MVMAKIVSPESLTCYNKLKMTQLATQEVFMITFFKKASDYTQYYLFFISWICVLPLVATGHPKAAHNIYNHIITIKPDNIVLKTSS